MSLSSNHSLPIFHYCASARHLFFIRHAGGLRNLHLGNTYINIIYYNFYLLSYGPNVPTPNVVLLFVMHPSKKNNQFPYYNVCKCVHSINI